MSIESLQRMAEAAGYATASDDNPDAPVRAARNFDAAPLSYPASLLAKPRTGLAADVASVAAPAIWGRASLGQFIPAWAAKI